MGLEWYMLWGNHNAPPMVLVIVGSFVLFRTNFSHFDILNHFLQLVIFPAD